MSGTFANRHGACLAEAANAGEVGLVEKYAIEYPEPSTRLPNTMFEYNCEFKSMDASPKCDMQASLQAFQLHKHQQLEDFMHRVQAYSQDLVLSPAEDMDVAEAKLLRKEVCRQLRKLAIQSCVAKKAELEF